MRIILIILLSLFTHLSHAESFDEIAKSALEGNDNAQNKIGTYFHNGDAVEYGLKQDYTKALYWYKKSSEQGNHYSPFNIGLLYEYGLGVKENDEEAFKWYKLSAERGLASAQRKIGSMYSDGKGVRENTSEAIKWYLKAAQQGNVQSMLTIAEIYCLGNGKKTNHETAFMWVLEAQKNGNAKKQIEVCEAYQNGIYPIQKQNPSSPIFNITTCEIHVKKDSKKAHQWCEKAASNDIDSYDENTLILFDSLKHRLGEFYENEEEYDKAIIWYKKSSKLGQSQSSSRLGRIYESGKTGEVNYEEAFKWFKIGVNQRGLSAGLIETYVLYKNKDILLEEWVEKRKRDAFLEKTNNILNSSLVFSFPIIFSIPIIIFFFFKRETSVFDNPFVKKIVFFNIISLVVYGIIAVTVSILNKSVGWEIITFEILTIINLFLYWERTQKKKLSPEEIKHRQIQRIKRFFIFPIAMVIWAVIIFIITGVFGKIPSFVAIILFPLFVIFAGGIEVAKVVFIPALILFYCGFFAACRWIKNTNTFNSLTSPIRNIVNSLWSSLKHTEWLYRFFSPLATLLNEWVAKLDIESKWQWSKNNIYPLVANFVSETFHYPIRLYEEHKERQQIEHRYEQAIYKYKLRYAEVIESGGEILPPPPTFNRSVNAPKKRSTFEHIFWGLKVCFLVVPSFFVSQAIYEVGGQGLSAFKAFTQHIQKLETKVDNVAGAIKGQKEQLNNRLSQIKEDNIRAIKNANHERCQKMSTLGRWAAEKLGTC